MIDSVIEIIGPWLFVSSLMVYDLRFTFKPFPAGLPLKLGRPRPYRILRQK